MIKLAKVCLVLMSFASIALMNASIANAGCKECKLFLGEWECWSASAGGDSCTASQTGCSMDGTCGGGPGEEIEMLLIDIEDAIFAIADEFPAIAVTLADLTKTGTAPAHSFTYWSPVLFETSDAASIIEGDESFEGRIVKGAKPIVHEVFFRKPSENERRLISTDSQEVLFLHVTPASVSSLGRPFSELVVVLGRFDSLTGEQVYEAVDWYVD